jgi:chemotaxis protein MotC
MSLKLGVALLFVLTFFGGQATAQALREIRSGLAALHQIQDEIASGTPDGAQLQPVILERVTSLLERLSAKELAEHDYQLALAELGLSGGERARVARLLRQAAGTGSLQQLLPAVEAYLDRDMGKAAERFEQADAASQGGANLDHFVALAKGTSLLETDLQRAREAFEHAILLAPGTLVEEVALRRLAAIGLKQEDPELFVRCAAVYLRRYASSPYSGEFLSGYADGAVLVNNRDSMERLADIAILLPTERSRRLLANAIAGLLSKGKIDLAKVQISRLQEVKSGASGAMAARAELELMEILAGINDSRIPDPLHRLLKLDGTLTTETAQRLLAVARHVAWNIHKPLGAPAGPDTNEAASPADIENEFASIDQSLVQATSALQRLASVKAAMP